ncbi:hypothetical protein KIL84_019545, partial [Mauremys mutica]
LLGVERLTLMDIKKDYLASSVSPSSVAQALVVGHFPRLLETARCSGGIL